METDDSDAAEPTATLIVRRPADLRGFHLRRFFVRIDKRWAGELSHGQVVAFPIPPGVRTVTIHVDWMRSLPFTHIAKPYQTVVVKIRARPRWHWFWRAVPMFLLAMLIFIVTNRVLPADDASEPVTYSRYAIMACIFCTANFLYVVVAPLYDKDYWALWELEPVADSPVTTFL